MWRIGRLVLSALAADPATYERPAALIDLDGVDHFYVNFHIRGRFKLTNEPGTTVSGGAGSVLVIDMSQPCRLEVGKLQGLSLAIPRRLLAAEFGEADLHCLVAKGGLVPALGSYLAALERSLNGVPAHYANILEARIVDLVADTLNAAFVLSGHDDDRSTSLIPRARAYMNERLKERLDVARIARDLGVSRSSLYRAFDGTGGVVRELQNLRLQRFRRSLENVEDSRSIALLAKDAGFLNASHLARVFQREFGQTPGSYRKSLHEQPVHPLPSALHEVSQTFRSWVTSVR